MKPTFLNREKPLMTAMVQCNNLQDCISVVKNSIYDGADAFGIQLCCLKKEFRNEETLKQIFSAAAGRPIYITSYRICQSEGMTDEECMEFLKLGLKSGATLADIMGDTFDRGAEKELTKNTAAIDKQLELIDEIHSMGKEVLMSSHIMKYIPADEVVEVALEQQRRGADIVKIVTAANNEEEEFENIKATRLLKKELEKPFLFLSGGTHFKMHRMLSPFYGGCMWLCVQHHYPGSTSTQPVLKSVKAVRDNFDLTPDIVY